MLMCLQSDSNTCKHNNVDVFTTEVTNYSDMPDAKLRGIMMTFIIINEHHVTVEHKLEYKLSSTQGSFKKQNIKHKNTKAT